MQLSVFLSSVDNLRIPSFPRIIKLNTIKGDYGFQDNFKNANTSDSKNCPQCLIPDV